jgi:EAL domain-containing protein (putative c-di-GMP-specific phosphodiesterase class I)
MVNLSGEPPASQPVDGPEGAVLLDHGEEDFRRRVQHLRAEGDDAAADVEFADLIDDPQQARALADIKVAVNLSPVQFKQAELFDMIKSALKNSGLPPERLEIEITESVLLERALENHAFIERLRGIGISLALDDFGTGYSSLGSLTAFPFNKIKIDKSFVADLTRNHKSTAIICSVLTLAVGLDMSVTVEGVETREQYERLTAMGVNFAQGYLMGRPMPIDELERQPQVYRSRQDAA